jgi:hypothetical protein
MSGRYPLCETPVRDDGADISASGRGMAAPHVAKKVARKSTACGKGTLQRLKQQGRRLDLRSFRTTLKSAESSVWSVPAIRSTISALLAWTTASTSSSLARRSAHRAQASKPRRSQRSRCRTAERGCARRGPQEQVRRPRRRILSPTLTDGRRTYRGVPDTPSVRMASGRAPSQRPSKAPGVCRDRARGTRHS